MKRKTTYGIRVRKRAGDRWKRGVQYRRVGKGWKLWRREWPTKAAAELTLAKYRKAGYAGHTYKIVRKVKPVTLQDKAWRQAQALVGVMEHGGNNSGTKVMEIIRANGGTGPEPWCGNFVAYCYRAAGSTAVMREWAAVRLLGRITGQRFITTPVKGDIVTFVFDHTGLFGWWSDAAGNKVPRSKATHIVTIEGNTGASGAVSDSSTGGDGVYQKVREIGLVDRFVRVTR